MPEMSAPRTSGRRSRPVEPPTEDDVRTALRSVMDPELGDDIVTLGMVPLVKIDPDATVHVTISLTVGGCPLRAEIRDAVDERVRTHPGVADVKIHWGAMTPEERSNTMAIARRNAQRQAPATRISPHTRIVAVASGKGGVGKSSVTANLAAALAESGRTVGVLDADIWGFSIPRLLGLDAPLTAERDADSDRPLIRPNERRIGDGVLKVVSTGFLVDESSALMWRGLMLNKAVEQFLRDVDWGDLDDLIIDMPPGTGDVQMGLARMLPRTSVVIVTTPATAAQTVAQRAADMARRSFIDVVGVVENMSAFTCEHGTEYALFGSGGGSALAESIGVPLLGQVPLEPAVAAGGDAGEPAVLGRSAAADAFRSIVTRLDEVLPPTSADDHGAPIGCTVRVVAEAAQLKAAAAASARA